MNELEQLIQENKNLIKEVNGLHSVVKSLKRYCFRSISKPPVDSAPTGNKQHFLNKVISVFNSFKEPIIIFDRNGKIDFSNDETSAILQADICSLNIDDIFPKKLTFPNTHFNKHITTAQHILQGELIWNSELSYTNPVIGSTTSFNFIGIPVYFDSDIIQGGIINLSKLTSQEVMEKKLIQSSNEKETLLRETHHRVKNNLAMITSLIGIQIDSWEDDKYKFLLTQLEQRIQSMALVHEQVLQSDTFSYIDFKEYIISLLNNLFGSECSLGNNIEIIYNIEEIYLDIDSCIPIGLIITELFTNALRHAFIEKQAGSIKIDISVQNKILELSIIDNGIGIPERLRNRATMGLRLVNALIDQLHGTLDFSHLGGTTVKITASVKLYDPLIKKAVNTLE